MWGFRFPRNCTACVWVCNLQPVLVCTFSIYKTHTGHSERVCVCVCVSSTFYHQLKTHLSQLLFSREDEKQECAPLGFPVRPSPIPAAAVTFLSSLVCRIIPMVSHCSLYTHAAFTTQADYKNMSCWRWTPRQESSCFLCRNATLTPLTAAEKTGF